MADDEHEGVDRRGRWRRPLLIALIVWAGLTLLREQGLVDLTFAETSRGSTLQTVHELRRTPAGASLSPGLGVTYAVEDHWLVEPLEGHRLIVAGREGAADGAQATEVSVAVAVEEADLSGLYWVPLYKTASCTYRVVATLETRPTDAPARVDGRIVVEGEHHLTVRGPSSVRSLREGLAASLSDHLREEVREQLMGGD